MFFYVEFDIYCVFFIIATTMFPYLNKKYLCYITNYEIVLCLTNK